MTLTSITKSTKALPPINSFKIFLGLIFGLTTWFCLSTNIAEGHRPAFPDGSNRTQDSAFLLDDIDISQAIYQILEKDQQVWLSFDPEISNTQTAIIQLGIPVLEETEYFRPMVAVLGKNLGKINLPFPIPEGLGAIVYESTQTNPIRKFHEPYTNTNSWILIEDEFQVLDKNIHYIVIFSKTNQSGKFWFATGTREVFNVGSLPQLTKNISKVKKFHEPSIAASNQNFLRHETSDSESLISNIDYFKSTGFYLMVGIFLFLIIVILIKIKTASK